MEKFIENGCFESEKIKHIISSDFEYIQFKKLLEYSELNHAYILKTNEMNFRVGKDFRNIENVKINLKKVAEELKFSYDNIIRPDYDHTNNVMIISEYKETEKPSLNGENFKETDGLITNLNEVPIMSTNADCNLIILYDPIKKVFANVHAGWRGTFGKIVQNAILKMQEEYGCDIKNIISCLCPSIRKCHFEVDCDVAELCIKIFEYTGRLEEIIEKGEIKEGKQKFYIDTVLINKILLEEIGVVEENIVDSEICSVCNSNKIHSRRADGLNFGLGMAIIQKNKN